MTEDECRSCRARIVWVTTEQGKSTPSPSRAGTSTTSIRSRALPGCGSWPTRSRPSRKVSTRPTDFRYVSHFATCPQADQWRKR